MASWLVLVTYPFFPLGCDFKVQTHIENAKIV
jgi:hypothetical protein